MNPLSIFGKRNFPAIILIIQNFRFSATQYSDSDPSSNNGSSTKGFHSLLFSVYLSVSFSSLYLSHGVRLFYTTFYLWLNAGALVVDFRCAHGFVRSESGIIKVSHPICEQIDFLFSSFLN